MNKKVLAIVTALILLVGCTVNDLDKRGEDLSTKNKTTQRTTQGEKDGTSINGTTAADTDASSAHFNEQGEASNNGDNTDKDRTSTHIKHENKEETSNNQRGETDEIKINSNTEDRLKLEEIFEDDIGSTYKRSSSSGKLQIDKLVDFGRKKYLHGIYFFYESYDLDAMEKGVKKFDSYYYNVSEKGIELFTQNTTINILKKEEAEKKESWNGDFITEQGEKFNADFKVIRWDENSVQIRIKSVSSGEKTFKEYKAIYTYEKGKGLTSISIKNNLEKNYEISVHKINENQRIELQKLRWPEIDKVFIQEDKIIKGYYDLSDEYYEMLKGKLKECFNIPEVPKEEALKILKEFYSKMPDESQRAVSYISDMGKIVYKGTDDPYFLAVAVKEYERRIKEFSKIYEEERIRYPKLHDGHIHWTKMLLSKPYFHLGVSETFDRRLNIYLDNFLKPVEYEDYRFAPTEKFIENLMSEEYPQYIKNYLNYKKYSYYTLDLRNNHLKSENLWKSIISMEEIRDSGDSRYDEFIEDIFKDMIKPKILRGKISKLYIKTMDDYAKSSKNEKHKEIISHIKELNKKHGGNYSEELNEYLMNFTNAISEKHIKYILEDAKENKHEEELYSQLENHYKEVEEIKSDNIVEVWNGYDFIKAVKDNNVIKVMDHIVIDPFEVDEYLKKINTFDGNIRFEGIKNLTIIGAGNTPIRVSAASTFEVFGFIDCENIIIRNLSIGHWNDACNGAVIYAENSSNIRVENSVLYGCGTIGLEYTNVKKASAVNTLIWDCSEVGIEFYQVQGAYLNNVIITENGRNSVYKCGCKDINEINVYLGN
ncbi:hypothetical protein [Oceanirhabdus sp. W0125-5]|uniref:hypothetical protein n=1 Tax=Oceanirhabdus sp. W0125-5 TaxID=2999116 RepID=UPI0022F2C0D2|nr:hypothetical protein [Oceanirhabdus sp. W0125-5]WBW97703.1 hypothetical protein OW730_02680 [Oceanirhabdus sp. W0125-5]